MKSIKIISIRIALLGLISFPLSNCERSLSEDVEFARFPSNPEVFIDGFSGGLNYFPFGGSKLDAFTVDTEVQYSGTAAMRFDIPNVGDPAGSICRSYFPR
ncbi:MAG: hypothetical protein U5K79_10140 [Cyclobacteriaceae bacterium]|nr:hypothetical protein [Cyclobacteriaceae bacterium]